MWKGNDRILKKFSTRNAYQDLQMYQNDVKWKDLVWFSQNIPKHAFILWLAFKGNLTTLDKARKWVKINDCDWESIVCEFADMRNGNNIGSVARHGGLVLRSWSALCLIHVAAMEVRIIILKGIIRGKMLSELSELFDYFGIRVSMMSDKSFFQTLQLLGLLASMKIFITKSLATSLSSSTCNLLPSINPITAVDNG
ncbi:reverse transcriptase zinc-binding domain-containing protein [Tanacetum coccineum]